MRKRNRAQILGLIFDELSSPMVWREATKISKILKVHHTLVMTRYLDELESLGFLFVIRDGKTGKILAVRLNTENSDVFRELVGGGLTLPKSGPPVER